MSWSISAEGPKDEALGYVRKQAADIPYKPGTPEGDDVVAAVARIEALASALAPSDKVSLYAYGSHSVSNTGLVEAGFSVSVKRVLWPWTPTTPPRSPRRRRPSTRQRR